jgi:hypothetical protein
MEKQGVFGYIIGKKKRLMHVQCDADLLWQILVREIYVLMKHYSSKEALQEAFEKIKITKKKPKTSDMNKCKIFTDVKLYNKIYNEDNKYNVSDNNSNNEWYKILRFCQGSYINILEAGYILNQKEEYGIVFMLDFNKSIVNFYRTNNHGIVEQCETASIEEIMNFDEMPTKSYIEIVTDMNDRFTIYYEKLIKIEDELEKLEILKQKAKIQNAVNIENKVDDLLYEMISKRKELILQRRVFYHRLKVLDLIDDKE